MGLNLGSGTSTNTGTHSGTSANSSRRQFVNPSYLNSRYGATDDALDQANYERNLLFGGSGYGWTPGQTTAYRAPQQVPNPNYQKPATLPPWLMTFLRSYGPSSQKGGSRGARTGVNESDGPYTRGTDDRYADYEYDQPANRSTAPDAYNPNGSTRWRTDYGQPTPTTGGTTPFRSQFGGGPANDVRNAGRTPPKGMRQSGGGLEDGLDSGTSDTGGGNAGVIDASTRDTTGATLGTAPPRTAGTATTNPPTRTPGGSTDNAFRGSTIGTVAGAPPVRQPIAPTGTGQTRTTFGDNTGTPLPYRNGPPGQTTAPGRNDPYNTIPGQDYSHTAGHATGEPTGGVFGWLNDLLHSTGYSDAEKNAIEANGALSARAGFQNAQDQIARHAAVTNSPTGFYAARAQLGRDQTSTLANQARQNQIDFANEQERRRELGGSGMQSLLSGEDARIAGLQGQANALAALSNGEDSSSTDSGTNSNVGAWTSKGAGLSSDDTSAIGNFLKDLFKPKSTDNPNKPGLQPMKNPDGSVKRDANGKIMYERLPTPTEWQQIVDTTPGWTGKPFPTPQEWSEYVGNHPEIANQYATTEVGDSNYNNQPSEGGSNDATAWADYVNRYNGDYYLAMELYQMGLDGPDLGGGNQYGGGGYEGGDAATNPYEDPFA